MSHVAPYLLEVSAWIFALKGAGSYNVSNKNWLGPIDGLIEIRCVFLLFPVTQHNFCVALATTAAPVSKFTLQQCRAGVTEIWWRKISGTVWLAKGWAVHKDSQEQEGELNLNVLRPKLKKDGFHSATVPRQFQTFDYTRLRELKYFAAAEYSVISTASCTKTLLKTFFYICLPEPEYFCVLHRENLSTFACCIEHSAVFTLSIWMPFVCLHPHSLFVRHLLFIHSLPGDKSRRRCVPCIDLFRHHGGPTICRWKNACWNVDVYTNICWNMMISLFKVPCT